MKFIKLADIILGTGVRLAGDNMMATLDGINYFRSSMFYDKYDNVPKPKALINGAIKGTSKYIKMHQFYVRETLEEAKKEIKEI